MEIEAHFSQLMLDAQKRAEEYFSTYMEEGKHQAEETKETATAHFAKLIRESQEKVREQLLVRELASIIASGDSLPQALQSFADRLSTHVRFDCITLSTPHGEGVRIEWSSGQESPRAGEVYPARDCATLWMAEHKTTHIEEDLSQSRQFPIDDLYQAQGLKSIIRIPLSHGRTFLGTLEISSRQAKAFGEDQAKFLELLSSQLGLPLEKLRLRSGERERMEFLAALVHEVKTPLTSIISSSKLLQEEIAASEPEQLTPRLIDNVLQSAERMERRISHFFELAVLRNAIYELTTEITDIKPMLQELILRVAPAAQRKGQDMVTELSDTLPWVKIDKRRMDQVVRTLLNNAIAFNPQGGTVTLRAKEECGRLIVQVADSGPGFAPQEQEEMFKPYYPAEADRQRSPELRLGLAVARELVELHGGILWMESELGKGSTFAFSLPISPDS
jgi:signal transduction histidine kinase